MKKTHHNPDYARAKDADVIKKGSGPAVPNKHWEINRNLTPEGNETAWGAFLPRKAKNRPTIHVKTNECDH
jgi:hypothetical protein